MIAHQFKITLRDVKPTVWRRILVPEFYTFWDFHVAIQDSMGWYDYYLHEFRIPDIDSKAVFRIGIPDPDFPGELPASWKVFIRDHFRSQNSTCSYVYDFGDYWQHSIKLEKLCIKPDILI